MSQEQCEYRYSNNQLGDESLYPDDEKSLSDSNITITQSRYDELFNNNNSSSKSSSTVPTQTADFHQNPQRKFNFHIIYIGLIFLLFIFIFNIQIKLNSIESSIAKNHRLYNLKIDNTRSYLFQLKTDLNKIIKDFNNNIDQLISELYNIKYDIDDGIIIL